MKQQTRSLSICAAFPLVALLLMLALLAGLLASGQVVVAEEPSDSAGRITTRWPAHAQLRLNGHQLIDQVGAHLGPPQFSPDRQRLAVVVVPTGNETAALARVYLFDAVTGQPLGDWAGHTPRWQADETLRWRDGQDEVQLDPATGRASRVRSADKADEEPSLAASLLATHSVLLAPPFPETIRVRHHASNGCRNLPAGQVDVIPFEEYVARVVPAEMPAFWDFDALAAQAVAARTYAWLQILVGRPDYDVTDWANFQVMCDARYPSSDEAAAATAGQYLSAVGDVLGLPILAMYSAENGHPTLTNPELDYLQAVPDLFSLGQERYGHGFGLSQWGAQRRARAGHSYRQILGYYYTRVHLQNALGSSAGLAALVSPLPGDQLTSGAIRWQPLTPLFAGEFTLEITSSNDLTTTVLLTDAERIWRTPISLTAGSLLNAQLKVDGAAVDAVALPVDGTAPDAPSFELPALLTDSVVPLAIVAQPDEQVGLRADWVWQGETLSHTAGSGELVVDLAAANGLTWQALAGFHALGVWYGPYTTVLPAGRSYRALFWLRSDVSVAAALAEDQSPRAWARLDVTDRGGEEILGLRDVWASDFAGALSYQPIAVDFHLFNTPIGLEFRVAWPGSAGLALDRVEVWTLPDDRWQSQEPLTWTLPFTPGLHTLAAMAFDRAGNPSPASVITTMLDLSPPTLVVTQTVVATNVVTVGWQATDDATGVTGVEIEQRAGGSDWALHPGAPFAATGSLLVSSEEEQPVYLRLRAHDGAGRSSEWQERGFFARVELLYLPLVGTGEENTESIRRE